MKNKKFGIVLNKIFTGSHLEYNIGHEIINFIKADDTNQRYIYLNPLGARGEQAAKETKYVFHIMESRAEKENGVYELVAVSKVDQNANVTYEKVNENNLEEAPKFRNHGFGSIFYCGEDSKKAYVYTYKCSEFYRTNKNRKIILKIKSPEAKSFADNNTLTIALKCNPQHSICYAYDEDESELKLILPPKSDEWLIKSDESVDLDKIPDEQSFAIISGRVQLEVSTSNQIAYFLGRDRSLLYEFLHTFLDIGDVTPDEQFEIVREKEKNIDLLFKSNNHVIVVENKIDSDINNVSKTQNDTGKYESQLSKYYKYIEKEYGDINKEGYRKYRKFFVLAPEYSSISQDKLNKYYENGEEYKLKTYTEFHQKVLDHFQYRPMGMDPSLDAKFLFKQFKDSIEYLTWSNAKQRENTAYIRLKQRIRELDAKEIK